MKSKIKSKKFALFAALLAVIACTLIGINLFSGVSKEERALALETATPTDADVDSSIITLKTKDSDDKNYTGVEYKVYRDKECMDEVVNFVLSWNGKSYVDSDGKPLVFKDPEELNAAGSNAYLHCEKLEVGSYFYRAEENLWKSSDDVSSIGFKWTEKAEDFNVKSGWDSADNPMKVEVGLEELPTEATTNEAIGIVATPDDASSETDTSSENTSEVATSGDTTEITTENTSEVASSTSEETSEATTEEELVATPSDVSYARFFSTFALVRTFAARLASVDFEPTIHAQAVYDTSKWYYMYRTGVDDYEHYYLASKLPVSDNTVARIYCGSHGASAPMYHENGTYKCRLSKSDKANLNKVLYYASKHSGYEAHQIKLAVQKANNTLNGASDGDELYNAAQKVTLPLTSDKALIYVGDSEPDIKSSPVKSTVSKKYKVNEENHVDIPIHAVDSNTFKVTSAVSSNWTLEFKKSGSSTWTTVIPHKTEMGTGTLRITRKSGTEAQAGTAVITLAATKTGQDFYKVHTGETDGGNTVQDCFFMANPVSYAATIKLDYSISTSYAYVSLKKVVDASASKARTASPTGVIYGIYDSVSDAASDDGAWKLFRMSYNGTSYATKNISTYAKSGGTLSGAGGSATVYDKSSCLPEDKNRNYARIKVNEKGFGKVDGSYTLTNSLISKGYVYFFSEQSKLQGGNCSAGGHALRADGAKTLGDAGLTKDKNVYAVYAVDTSTSTKTSSSIYFFRKNGSNWDKIGIYRGGSDTNSGANYDAGGTVQNGTTYVSYATFKVEDKSIDYKLRVNKLVATGNNLVSTNYYPRNGAQFEIWKVSGDNNKDALANASNWVATVQVENNAYGAITATKSLAINNKHTTGMNTDGYLLLKQPGWYYVREQAATTNTSTSNLPEKWVHVTGDEDEDVALAEKTLRNTPKYISIELEKSYYGIDVTGNSNYSKAGDTFDLYYVAKENDEGAADAISNGHYAKIATFTKQTIKIPVIHTSLVDAETLMKNVCIGDTVNLVDTVD